MLDIEAEVKEIFHQLDKDKSGKISAAELKAALEAHSGIPEDDENVKLFIAKVDANKDGELSLEELMSLFKQ